MADAGSTLVRAWRLARSTPTDAEWAELESLLPELAVAGYVDLGEERWSFTPAAVATIGELLPDEPSP